MIQEIFKDIQGYDGLYQISSWGNVKSLRNKSEKILTSHVDKNGYYNFVLSLNGKIKNLSVHRVVAIAFIPNLENKSEVNHIDGDKSNNHISNLEWTTRSENQKHSFANGLNSMRRGGNNHMAKKVLQINKDNVVVGKWDCIKDAIISVNGTYKGISNSCNDDNIYYKDFKWEYSI